ncbi:AAA family ATPase [Gordonia sp. NPDC003429]
MWELRQDRKAVIRAAIADAQAGSPRLICIDGAAGMGKTSHLEAILAAATGFTILEASGDESTYRPPYGLLDQLGVRRTLTDAGAPLAAAVAANSLRRLIDEASVAGPVVIAVDDAQWADDESLDALARVFGRLAGDRLLLVVASRPVRSGDQPAWQRLRSRLDPTISLQLDGVTLDEAANILDAVWGGHADPLLVNRLWEHTGRNPLYLRSLAAEYPPDALAMAQTLPAPVEVARELDARLAALDEDAAQLLRTIAVVGSGWVDRLDVGAIAGIDDTTTALDLLLASDLVVAQAGLPLAQIRIVHALVRAAVYATIPANDRRMLHLRAAEVLTAPMVRIEHEVTAAAGRDDVLAARLEQLADEAALAADHRREAQLRTWSSQLTSAPEDRERRWLDAQLAAVLAKDVTAVRAHLSQVAWAADIPRRTLVLAWLLVVENQVTQARQILAGLTPKVLAAGDIRTRQRLLVLTAWVHLASGAPTEQVQQILDTVPEHATLDAAVRPLYLRTAGQIAARVVDVAHLVHDLNAVPDDARSTPLADTDRLGWRGAVYALCGFTPQARRDLSEVVARQRFGQIDAGPGTDHALYGYALWQDGEFGRAAVEAAAATEVTVGRPHPLVQATLAFVPIVRGEASHADELIDETEEQLRELPWREAVSVLMISRVARLHAGGDTTARAAYVVRAREIFGADICSAERIDGALWHLHVALAKIWAGEQDDVEGHLRAIETDIIVPGWAAWARPWLLGLAAEASDDLAGAVTLVESAVASFDDALPLYRAHVLTDAARVMAASGAGVTAREMSDHAQDLYRRLGATAYVRADESTSRVPRGPLAALTDREREVAELAASGYSYAQIADELYVTRSTISFHLGRVYAKTGVSTRHELSRLIRDNAG